MIQDIVLHLVIAIVKIVAAIAFSVNAAYIGMSLLDKITASIDEWKEIKKGNVAVGLLYGAAILSLILLVEPQIFEFVNAIDFSLPAQLLLAGLVFAMANYFVAIMIGVIVIYLSIHIIDHITPDLEELKELKKGNVAVALIIAVVLIAIAFALRGPFESIFETIKALELLLV